METRQEKKKRLALLAKTDPKAYEAEMAKASDEEKPKATKEKAQPKPKAQPKAAQPEEKKITALSTEGQKAIEEKAEILKTKTFYNTAGHTWEISPNIQDLQYNGYQKEREEITNLLKSVGHWNHSTNKPNTFSESKTEGFKANGEIQVLPFKFKGHDEIQYMIFLLPKKDMDIRVFRGIHYPWDSKTGKSQAKAAGRDNREYTFKYSTTIQLKAGEAIPLGSTTNYGKAINNYGSHWANIYKVHFSKSGHPDKGRDFKEIYHIDTNDLWNTTSEVKVIGPNSGHTLRTGTMAEILGMNTVHNIGYLADTQAN